MPRNALGPLGRLSQAIRQIGKRSFEGAAVNRLTADFNRAWIQSPTQEVKYDLKMLRARARYLAQNNAHAKRFLRLLEKNVVGAQGLQLRPRARMLRGDKPHDEANDILRTAWAAYGKRGRCTVDGQLSWNAFTKLVLRTVATDGEAFVQKVRYADTPDAFAVKLLDADLFDEYYDVRAMPNGHFIRMGVEFDQNERPVAYWMWNQHPQDVGWGGRPLERVRVSRDDIEHVFFPTRAGQPRGYSWFAPVIVPLKMLRGYGEAELVAARTAAAKMGFITTDGSDDGPDPGMPGDEEHRLMDAAPGSIEELQPGQKFESWDPQHPSGNYDPFTSAILREVAMGLDISVISLDGNLKGTSYSSGRMGSLDERDTYRELQQFLAEHLCDPVYAAWVPCAMLAGTLALQGPAARWLDVQWRGRGWAWVDPLKDVQATILEIDAGLNSRTQALDEIGEDFDQITDELAAEQQLMADKGIALGTRPLPGVPKDGDQADDPNAPASDSAKALSPGAFQAIRDRVRLLRGTA